MNARHGTRLVAGVLCLTATLTVPARADWPSARHDVRRTGAATGTSDLVAPRPFWKYFHGGSVDSSGALVVDLNGDGTPEVVVAGTDGVSARSPFTGDTLWTNKDCASASGAALEGLADVNGDGTPELVLRNNDRAFLVRLADGATLWGEPPGEMGTLSAVRIGDLSGDGKDDLVMNECQCCGINSGKSAVAYRFAGQGATLSSPKMMWAPKETACGGAAAASLAKMRDTKKVDFVFGRPDRLVLLDGPTGTVVAESPALGSGIQASQCRPVDVDGDAREELLCVLNQSNLNGTGHRAYLLRHVTTPTPRLELVWQHDVGIEDNLVRIPASFVGDLDGDGKLEVVLGGKLDAMDEATFVLDAATGAERAKLVGKQPLGIAPILDAGASALVTRKETALQAYELTGSMLVERASLTDHEPLVTVDYTAGQRGTLRDSLLTFDRDGDGVAELATTRVTTGAFDVVRWKSGALEIGGTYAPPDTTTFLGAWPAVLKGKPTVALAQSDGNLHLLDATLSPLSGNPSFGVRFGNYFANSQFRSLWRSPVIGSLGDAVPGVLLVDSRSALVRLDARTASFAEPPKTLWTREHTIAPQIVKGLDGGTDPASPGIAAVERRANVDDRVVALTAKGALLWERQLAGIVLTDMVAGNLDGDGIPDLIVEHGKLTDLVHLVTALSGETGAVLWSAAPIGPTNRQPPGGAMADWNGDGRDDFVYVAAGKTRILGGKDGKLLGESVFGGDYYTPILFDVDTDEALEITLYAGYSRPLTIDNDLTKLVWQGTDEDRPLTYGAMTRCNGTATLVGGSWATPSRLSRYVAGGPTAGTTTHQILGSGKIYANVASANGSGARLGQLGSPSLHDNLAGDNVTIAVVGSGDGWLYGIEACSGGLRFAHEIGAPVGAVAFGDANGDGKDELIASSADGHLYAFRQLDAAPPTEVLDTDPPGGFSDEDVDAIVTQSTLHARWTKAAGATGYEVAVIRDGVDGGGFVTAEPWRSVGDVDSASIDGLTLVDGRRYFVAVRAVVGDERSIDALSDGVRVYFDEKPTSTASGAGSSGSGAGGSGAGGNVPSSGPGGVNPDGSPTCVTGGCGSCATAGNDGSHDALTWTALMVAGVWMRRRTKRAA
ncbi:MAG: VCBS repeat-containing protein [Deltaproteobacteria bacterium]|nr:VCBS repeat-containing protein [Deltaproteobacteria bacterium]